MYLAYNEGKSFATERFIKTLKNKIDKHMTAVSKKVKSNSYAVYNVDSNEKIP